MESQPHQIENNCPEGHCNAHSDLQNNNRRWFLSNYYKNEIFLVNIYRYHLEDYSESSVMASFTMSLMNTLWMIGSPFSVLPSVTSM